MKERKIEFATLKPDGTLTNVRHLAQSTIQKCPHFIMDPDHYKADGTCLCFDGAYQDKLRKERQARTNKLLMAQKR
jgi:hypothetical protein